VPNSFNFRSQPLFAFGVTLHSSRRSVNIVIFQK
jgi:hypothetical protein